MDSVAVKTWLLDRRVMIGGEEDVSLAVVGRAQYLAGPGQGLVR